MFEEKLFFVLDFSSFSLPLHAVQVPTNYGIKNKYH